MKQIATVLTALLTSATYAGGNIGGVDFTHPQPSSFLGEGIVPLTQQRWADNCILIPYSLNTTQDPIPNPNGGPGLPLVIAKAAIRRALSTWTDISTSYIDMQLSGTTDNPGSYGFDFVNEVTFTSAFDVQAAAFSQSTTLAIDITLVEGDDLDLDGDSDVSAAITTCGDVDGDGDIELPAKFYPAGTIIDNDVVFNPAIQWIIASMGETQEAGQVVKLDVQGVATHEFGHSHGLAHSMINQTSPRDGGKATMWFGGRDNAFNVYVGGRSLHTDDIVWSSFHYPEGSTNRGPGALQIGDTPFKSRYSVISGEVTDANGIPVLGANPYAVTSDGTIVSSAISGHAQVSGSLTSLAETTLGSLPVELGIIDGRYQLPVPRGIYRIGIEGTDRAPMDANHQNITGILGGIYGQTDFPEDFWNGNFENKKEKNTERQLGLAQQVRVFKDRNNINFVTSKANRILNVNEYTEVDVGLQAVSAGAITAVRVPTQQLIALDEGHGILVQAALFGMAPFVSTNVPIVDAAMITTGQVFEDGTASIDLEHPLVHRRDFVGQDTDLAPLYVENPEQLGDFITQQLAGTQKDIFLVVQFPDEEPLGLPGGSNVVIMLDFLEPDETTFGYSYHSRDGGTTFQQFQSLDVNAETYFGLLVTPRKQ